MGRYDYESGTVYGVVLLPDPETSDRCRAYSEELARLAPSELVLGSATTLPHITVVHARGGIGPARDLWDRIVAELGAPVQVEVEAIGIDIHPSEDVPAPALLDLHRTVVGHVAGAGHDILSDHSDRYWPHITLGWWREPPHRLPSLPPLLSARFTARLHLTEMGRHGTVVGTL